MSADPLVLSLFPGIGLLDMAFEGAGFCVVRGPVPLPMGRAVAAAVKRAMYAAEAAA